VGAGSPAAAGPRRARVGEGVRRAGPRRARGPPRRRAARDRARVLRRPHAVGDRGRGRRPARHREDVVPARPDRAAPGAGRPGRMRALEADATGLAVQYVMGELPATERVAFERRLAGEPDLAAEVQRLRATLGLLPYATVTAPPPDLRGR